MCLSSFSDAGGSGGGVFNRDGHLIGVVTSNTRHAGSGRSFARLNYSIASSALIPIVDAVCKQQISAVNWAALDTQDAAVAAIWELRDEMQRPGKPHGSVQRLEKVLEESVNKDNSDKLKGARSRL